MLPRHHFSASWKLHSGMWTRGPCHYCRSPLVACKRSPLVACKGSTVVWIGTPPIGFPILVIGRGRIGFLGSATCDCSHLSTWVIFRPSQAMSRATSLPPSVTRHQHRRYQHRLCIIRHYSILERLVRVMSSDPILNCLCDATFYVTCVMLLFMLLVWCYFSCCLTHLLCSM